jgi:non-specific serine/threonine protein kinase
MDDGKAEPNPGSPNGGARGIYLYRFANVEFDESTSTLQVADQPVAVERLPLNLLAELLRRPNEVITRGELFDVLWPGRITVDHVLANAVNKLRRALGDEGAARLVNVPRVGYRLAGPVQRTAVGRRPVAASPPLGTGLPVPGRDAMELERPLGGGSANAVWLARDPKLRLARVYKFAFDADSLAALKREYTVYRVLRQALGERDDFACVLAANFSDAPYFLECEYGGPELTQWAAEGGRLQALPVPERLTLFLQIARAVAAAHGVGVLHKDLKPGNVLVGGIAGAWQARLTDFGNSRLLEPDRLAELGVTAMGLTVTYGAGGGTPLYLAPELLAGRPPTTGSDLYALGLMLYQMLVADFRRPMSTGWQRDIADDLLVEDLTVATEGRPGDRLASVADFVERLSTLEERRAERAARAAQARQAADAALQLQRSRARRPWVAAAFVGLGIGLAASLWFYVQARTAQHLAEQESARAQAINDFMNKDVLQSADVLRAKATRAVSMFDILQRASERARERFAGQPRTEASVRRQLGDIYLRMQYLSQAEAQFARAIELLEPRVPARDEELLAARFASAQTSVGMFHPAEALQKLEAAERAAGPAVLGAPSDLARRALRARVEVMMDAQRPQEALAAALPLVALSDSPLGGDDVALRFEARQRLGEVYLRLGDKSKADELFAELAKPPFSDSGVGDVLLARARLRVGREHINEGRLDDAEAILTGVRDTMTRAFGPNELYAGGANLELIDLHYTRGDFAKAAAAGRAAVEAFATSVGEQHHYTLHAIASLAGVELELGEAAQALARVQAIRPVAAASRDGAPLIAAIDFASAKALTHLGRAGEALPLLETVSAEMLAESSWGPRDFQWQLQVEKGRALLTLGQREHGLDRIRSAIAEMEKLGSHAWLLERYRELLREPPRLVRR